jgi:hypothetical protein
MSILYFVLAFFIPLAILVGIDAVTGGQALDPRTPAARVWMGIYRFIWFAVLLGGVKVAVGRGSKMGGAFVGFVIAIFVIMMFARTLWLEAPLDPIPVWLEVITFIAVLIAAGSANTQIARQGLEAASGDAYSTRSLFIKMSGTLQGMFFSFTIRSCVFPAILGFLVCVFTRHVPEGWKIVFAIYGYWWAFAVLDMALRCNILRYQNAPYDQLKKKKASRMAIMEARMLALPVFGLCLIRYFDWWPMKTWVIVLYAVYMAVWLLMTIWGARRDPAEV